MLARLANNNNNNKNLHRWRLKSLTRHKEHTQVYFGVSRFSESFTLLENMSCFLGEVEAGKSHYRSCKFSLCSPETELVCSLAACFTKIETFFPVGSLRRVICVTSLQPNDNKGQEGNQLPIGGKNDDPTP